MKLYKNGDRCPCCGQRIEGKSDDWLELFSQTVDMLRIPPWEAQALSDEDARTAEGGDLIRRCGATFPVRGEGREAEP